MKKTNLTLLALLFLATLASCSSDSSGDSNGTTTGDYFPMAVNNKWEYNSEGTVTEVNLIGTASFGGTTYYEMTDTQNPFSNQNWVVKKGASYFQRTGETTEFQASTTIVIQPYEMKILQDDLAVGEGWQGTVSPRVDYSGPAGSGNFNANIHYEGTITAKGVSETLGGITYNDIIKVALTATVNANGQVSTITGEYWFAKDIGIVYDHETSTADGSNTLRILTAYTLH